MMNWKSLRLKVLFGFSFEPIQSAVRDVMTQIQEASAAVQLMAGGTEQMVQSMRFIAE
ncbi:hypothetical protein [Paenibacillus cremeus]|uniref:hypothetical protein n=1 Tax=Paenibacillus cremeus TaxID=2163881 RepID=UPI001647D168|nr:hypothetical protein [Paenibacillus cremeus]